MPVLGLQPPLPSSARKIKVEEVLERAKKQRRLHPLYLKLCAHFGLNETEPLYKGMEAMLKGKERRTRKSFLALEAIKETLAGINDTQWALSGNEGERKFLDFNQAQRNGDTGSISMGGDVGDKLKKAFATLAANHSELLASAVAEVRSRSMRFGLESLAGCVGARLQRRAEQRGPCGLCATVSNHAAPSRDRRPCHTPGRSRVRLWPAQDVLLRHSRRVPTRGDG